MLPLDWGFLLLKYKTYDILWCPISVGQITTRRVYEA